ncbi:MAG: hypothetical protein OXK79_03895, partial [Chloroflexota bacterium]|nr:hypothetical protein [Chloroflexota bacterium]
MDIETRRLRTVGHRPLAVGLRAFVEGQRAVDSQPRDRDEAYAFVRDTLERFAYGRLGRRGPALPRHSDGDLAAAGRAPSAAVARRRRGRRSAELLLLAQQGSEPDLQPIGSFR